jgi:2-polyprenyl-3-methyl-5-hydroxy-6-metoxy-1,4-benzoquinol methylase
LFWPLPAKNVAGSGQRKKRSAMDCCQCQGIESQFDQAEADAKLRDYRRRGPAKSTRVLIDALVAAGVAGRTLLDIGGGIGAVQHALLEAGAAHSTDVDASRAYLTAARSEAERQGYASRATFRYGNFAAIAGDIEPADIVTLDRVICCYHDMPALVGSAAAKARRVLGLVYPRDTWWVRAGIQLENGLLWLQRTSFRVFAHASHEVDVIVQSSGMARILTRNAGIWQVVVYARNEEGNLP